MSTLHLAAASETTMPEPCECEGPGYFYSGPGIIARVENGILVAGAAVERCHLCRRYASDEAATERLQMLGIASLR